MTDRSLVMSEINNIYILKKLFGGKIVNEHEKN